MKTRCKAVLIVIAGNARDSYHAGKQCPCEAMRGKAWCWTHQKALEAGTRTEQGIKGGGK